MVPILTCYIPNTMANTLFNLILTITWWSRFFPVWQMKKSEAQRLSNLPQNLSQINNKAEIEPRPLWLLAFCLECYFPKALVL